MLEINEGELITLDSVESKIVKLQIPELNGEIDRLVMKAHRTTKKTNGSYAFYVNIGDDNPTPLDY